MIKVTYTSLKLSYSITKMHYKTLSIPAFENAGYAMLTYPIKTAPAKQGSCLAGAVMQCATSILASDKFSA